MTVRTAVIGRLAIALPLLLAGSIAVPARGAGESVAGREAFMQPPAGLAPDARLDWQLGRSLFRKLWVPSPASTGASDGLGPLYNARSCMTCHVRNGRGRPLAAAGASEAHRSLALHLADAAGGADPRYGRQLQTAAATGLPAEGRVQIDYTAERATLAGGATVDLRRPRYRIEAWGYGAPARMPVLSPRLAPPMIGLGLLEAIDAAAIRAGADPDDRDGDGISGRAAEVRSASRPEATLGRFGWRAAAATVADQSALALVDDLGLSNPLVGVAAGDCTAHQAACMAAPDGNSARDGDREIGEALFARLALYAANLDVPPRRAGDRAAVGAGEALFAAIGCAACHRPAWQLGRSDGGEAGRTIHPYSDLLLHDMGEGLADQGTRDEAGREWRTAPLWGIGLTEAVGGQACFLHDGRARSLTEAILWHGGEARPARDAFAQLQPQDRERLLAFLNSL